MTAARQILIEGPPTAPRDRRRHCRRPCTHQATAILDDGSPMACIIEDISAGGACIRFTTAVDLPQGFVLEIAGLTLRVEVQVIWNQSTRYGVKFVWPQLRPCEALGLRPWIAPT